MAGKKNKKNEFNQIIKNINEFFEDHENFKKMTSENDEYLSNNILAFCNAIKYYDNNRSYNDLIADIIHDNMFFFCSDIQLSDDNVGKVFSSLIFDEKLSLTKWEEISEKCMNKIYENKYFDDISDEEKIELAFFVNETYAANSIKNITKKIENKYDKISFKIFNLSQINDEYLNWKAKEPCVARFVFEMDAPGNFLKSPKECKLNSVIVNLKSKSIKDVYEKHGRNNGSLYNLNLRYHIKNKSVDGSLNKTIENDSENFWYFNNGIVVICENFEIKDNGTIELNNFSFVNGGQTTFAIGNTDYDNLKEFYVATKIIKTDTDITEENAFANKISIATNKQKAIKEKDLIANSEEVLNLAQKMRKSKNNIILISKRGQTKPKQCDSIDIDKLMQQTCSFYLQMPGTTKSKKASLFCEPLRNKLFSNINVDLIQSINNLYNSLDKVSKELLKTPFISQSASKSKVLKTGKFFVFSLISFLWSWSNNLDELSTLVDNKTNNINEFQNEFVTISKKTLLNFKSTAESENNLKILVNDIVPIIDEAFKDWEINNSENLTDFANFTKKDSSYLHCLRYAKYTLSMDSYKFHEIRNKMVVLFDEKN